VILSHSEKLNNSYAGKPLSSSNPLDTQSEASVTVAVPTVTFSVTNPRRQRVAWFLNRLSQRRFGLRLFRSAAISIALSESLLFLFGAHLAPTRATTIQVISTTLVLSLSLITLCGIYLLGGFVDNITKEFLETRCRERGQSLTFATQVTNQAMALWLSILAAIPLTITTLVILIRARVFSDVLLGAQTGLLALGVSELFAFCVFLAVHGLQRFDFTHPRRKVMLILLGFEVLRTLEPSIPSLYTLIDGLGKLISRWSLWP
jgi:hypothetical protein